jgi:hypothetical protein
MSGSGRLSREWERDPAPFQRPFPSPFEWLWLVTLASVAIVLTLTFPNSDYSSVAFLIAP